MHNPKSESGMQMVMAYLFRKGIAQQEILLFQLLDCDIGNHYSSICSATLVFVASSSLDKPLPGGYLLVELSVW